MNSQKRAGFIRPNVSKKCWFLWKQASDPALTASNDTLSISKLFITIRNKIATRYWRCLGSRHRLLAHSSFRISIIASAKSCCVSESQMVSQLRDHFVSEKFLNDIIDMENETDVVNNEERERHSHPPVRSPGPAGPAYSRISSSISGGMKGISAIFFG